jgi:phosphoglucomutase
MMSVNVLAGKVAPYEVLINVPRLISAYYTYHPDPGIPSQRVAFGNFWTPRVIACK